MESYKTFIKNNRTVLTGHILIYAQGIILIPIIIKSAGVVVYGGYILLLTLLGFTYGISSWGVGFKSGRFLPSTEDRDARRTIFYPQFCFQLLSITIMSLLLVIVFFPFLNRVFFKNNFFFSKWLIFPYLLFYSVYAQVVSYFRSTHRINHFNYATIAFPYFNIGLIVLVYFIRRNLTLNILFGTQILSYVLVAVPLVIMLIREIGLKFMLPDLKSLIDDIRLGFPLKVNYVMDFLLGSSDRYLITYFIGVAAVGYYNPAYAIGSLIVFFPSVSGVVLLPLLAKAIDAGKEAEASSMLYYTIKGFLLLAIPFIIATIVMSNSILKLFANLEISQKSYLVTPIVAAATLFFGLNIILSNALWARMKTSIILKMNAIAAAVNLGLNIIFLYIFKNILVSAITTLISYLTAFIIIQRAVKKDWPLNFEFKTIYKSIFSSLFMGGVIYWLSTCSIINRYGIWSLLVEIFIGAVVYSLVLFILKIFSEKEMKYLRNAFS